MYNKQVENNAPLKCTFKSQLVHMLHFEV